MTDCITTRLGTAADAPLLFTLFAEEKAAELAPLGLAAEQIHPLIEMQYRSRQIGYMQSSQNPTDSIFCLADGTPVGRVLTDRQPDCYRVMDIAVLAAYRGRGIGTHALRQIQLAAAKESVPVRLHVARNSPAERLYRRLGFAVISSDEIFSAMEWRPSGAAALEMPRESSAGIVRDQVLRPDHEELVQTIVSFLRGIGLAVHFGSIPSGSFLPGIQIVSNGLRIDRDALLFPGDLLHEAGHLAVMPPSQRHSPPLSPSDAAEEMGAIAWSYAAALHIGIDPEIVFHEHGYRGQASQLLHDFAHGKAVGLPYLWWIGMTTQPQPGQPSIYPRMLHWLRQETLSAQKADTADYALEAYE